MNQKDQLQLRKRIKVRKPKFRRQDSHKKKRFSPSWRRPRGIHSKMRRGLRGHGKTLGNYSSPSGARGKDSSGVQPVMVTSLKDLESLDPRTQGAIIARGVGLKKKVEIVRKAQEKKITLLNLNQPREFLQKVEETFKKKREEKKKKSEEKKKKKQEKEKKAEEKKKQEEEEKKKKSEEKKEEKRGVEERVESEEKAKEEKEKEKKELDKVLTKKE